MEILPAEDWWSSCSTEKKKTAHPSSRAPICSHTPTTTRSKAHFAPENFRHPGWFKPWPFLSPIVGGHKQPLKGSPNHPKKVTKNCQAVLRYLVFFGKSFHIVHRTCTHSPSLPPFRAPIAVSVGLWWTTRTAEIVKKQKSWLKNPPRQLQGSTKNKSFWSVSSICWDLGLNDDTQRIYRNLSHFSACDRVRLTATGNSFWKLRFPAEGLTFKKCH